MAIWNAQLASYQRGPSHGDDVISSQGWRSCLCRANRFEFKNQNTATENHMTHSSSIDPAIDALTKERFPEAAQALRTASTRIMERWSATVAAVLATAEDLTLSQLRGHVPRLLEQIAAALASDQPASANQPTDATKPLGEIRFQEAYNVNELLIEYQLLRSVILEEMAATLGRGLSTSEAVAFNGVFDTAQRRGAATFVDHLTRQLKTADDLQTNYITYLNHDLRGGMNGILLMVEVLKRELSAEPRFAETTEDLEAMRRSVLESVATMDRFVFAHRLGRGKQKVRFNVMNVKSIIHEVIQGLSHSARERHVEISVEASELIRVESDPDLLRLILQNVIGNAIKHSHRAGGRVKIEAVPQAKGGCGITIRDEGPGITAVQLEHIFSSSSSSGIGKQGFKLGLPVSKMAADILGATLTVDSVPGKGTTVSLNIPDHQTPTGNVDS